MEDPTIDANQIAPPVTLGRVPSTVTHSFGPEPLVPGTTYTFALWRILPKGSSLQCQNNVGTACLIAVTMFTR